LNSHGEIGKAEQLCNALVLENNGVKYSDWFLPSKDELNLMYENLKVYGVGGFHANYWSSSQYNANFTWIQNFYSGNQYYNFYKTNIARVRAVRAF